MMEESVLVTTQSDSVASDDSSVGTVIGRGLIDSLPLSGRGLLTLLGVTPGVVITPAGSGESGQFSAAGRRAPTGPSLLAATKLASGFRTPISIQWNTTLEQEIAKLGVVSVSYLGSSDHSLLRNELLTLPGLGYVDVFTTRGDASYQALQTQARSHIHQRLDAIFRLPGRIRSTTPRVTPISLIPLSSGAARSTAAIPVSIFAGLFPRPYPMTCRICTAGPSAAFIRGGPVFRLPSTGSIPISRRATKPGPILSPALLYGCRTSMLPLEGSLTARRSRCRPRSGRERSAETSFQGSVCLSSTSPFKGSSPSPNV